MDGLDSTSVKEELAIWREKYIDVTSVYDEFVTLRGRTVMLRDEVRVPFLQIASTACHNNLFKRFMVPHLKCAVFTRNIISAFTLDAF